MITFEIIYAVLLGVHPENFTFLDRPWRLFCYSLFQLLSKGEDPLAALKASLESAFQEDPLAFKSLIAQIRFAENLPKLSHRQKQLLIALRYAKVASLTQLSKIVAADRSNTHRRLAVLVRKGHALKFFSETNGVSYAAIREKFDNPFKRQVHQILDEQLGQVSGSNASGG
jgi:DNA-binding MarR family transcriptional regulator